MSYELNKIECKLVDLLKLRGVNQNSCIGTMLKLETDANYKKMFRWIKKNPHAGQTEILRHLRMTFLRAETAPIPAQQSPTPTAKRVRKIVVL